jgi:hypothetical protein
MRWIKLRRWRASITRYTPSLGSPASWTDQPDSVDLASRNVHSSDIKPNLIG